MTIPAVSSVTSSTSFGANFTAAKADDWSEATVWVATTSTGWLRKDYASAWVAGVYWVQAQLELPLRSPKNWTFEGWDGSAWTVLDTRTNETGWVANEVRAYTFTNSTAYSAYRINVTANNGDTYLSICELELGEPNLTAGSDPYPAAVAADSPKIFLRWSETSGRTVQDCSGNYTMPARLTGTYTRNATSLMAAGSDPAVDLGGGYASILKKGFASSGTAMCVEAVFTLDTLSTYAGIGAWDNEAGGARNFIFRVDPDGKLTFLWWNSGGGPYSVSTATGVITTGVRRHVAAKHDGTNVSILVDGVVAATTTRSGGVIKTNTARMWVGSQDAGTYPMDGVLDDWAYYDTAPSDAAIAAHAAAVTSTGGPAPVTGTIAGTLPALTGSLAGTVTDRGSIAGVLPALTGALAAVTPRTGTISGALPALTGTLAGTSGTTAGVLAGTLPALTGDLSGVVTATGAIAGTLPALTGALEGVNVGAGASGALAGSLPALTGSLVGDVPDTEPVALALAEVVVEAFAVVELSPAADIDVAVPILSEKHPAPVLSASQTSHQAWVDYTPTTEVVGYAHLWVDGQDVTYFRDKPVLIRNWTAEAPWGDKTALWEMPQLDEWDVPGEGDLSWLRPDAPVVIGIVDLDGVVHRKWSGFYHARTTGFDSARDFVFEAHGGMWAAMWQTYEPPPYQKPIDIGRLVPRLLNQVIGRRWNPIPEVATGILTRYRGSRDQRIWQAVQDILTEAWTDDGRQWTLVQVADDEYRLQLKADPATTVDGEFAYGNPAIDVDLTVDEDSRVDIVKARGIAPGGGSWANVKYPGVELLNGLPYPNSDAGDFINPGETDADTDSGTGVTDWQTKAKDLGYADGLTVTGVMSSDWVDVVYRVQRALSLAGVDGQIGPETWTATFNEIDESIDLTPRRLPMAYKPEAWPWKDAANGAILGPNPAYDKTMIPREVPLDLGPGVTKAEGFAICRTYLAVNGDAVVTGRMSFRGCLDDLARTDLTVGSNVKVNGYLGRDVAVQFGRVSVDLDTDSGGVYVVSGDVDERARDALTIDQILARNRDALPDPARRPGNPNRSSRQVRDEGFSWDAESPCGVLTRTAVNGDAGYWSRKTIPFAEVGQLAGIRLHSTVPFAFAIFATLRMTPRKMRQLMPGGPFSSTDPWRPIMDTLEGTYGLLGAWGAQNDACGYGGGMESDGYSFTGEFIESNTLEYITETPPYVDVFLYARGDSGFVWGDFLPARQT